MGFKIVHSLVEPKPIWVPVDYASAGTTLYVGQIVQSTSDGVLALGAASGAADTTGEVIPYGIVVGTNNRTPVFDSTYNTDKITSVQSQANQVARDVLGAEGMHPKGDPAAMVEIVRIYPGTLIKGPIYNSSFGTAPSVTTVTTGSTTGAGYTAGACDFTPVADLCTSFCRSGLNRGIYRISTDTSTTVRTFTLYWPYDVTIGDTFVSVPIRQGKSYMQLDSTSQFVDCSATPATNYYVVHVEEIDLRVAGQESVIFSFAPVHFAPSRS